MGKLAAAGFDGDVLDFGTPARRAAVMLGVDGVAVSEGRWTAFERPVDCLAVDCGCLVLGPDDVALLRDYSPRTPRARAFMRTLKGGRSSPRQGIACVDGMVVWVTSVVDAEELLVALHNLLLDETVRAVHEGRADDANQLAWRLWRASVTVEEKAFAIAALERSKYPQHASLVIGKPQLLSDAEREVMEAILFHARQGFDWALRLREIGPAS